MAEAHREEIAKLEALYAAHPEGRVFTHLAEAYRRAGELGRARDILEDGLRRHPDYSSAHVVFGRVLMDLDEAAAAAAAFRRVLELDRHNLVALRSLGDLAEKSGDRAAAIGYYRDLIALDPTDDRLRVAVARLEEELAAATAGADAREPVRAEQEPPQPSAGVAELEPAPWQTDAEPPMSEASAVPPPDLPSLEEAPAAEESGAEEEPAVEFPVLDETQPVEEEVFFFEAGTLEVEGLSLGWDASEVEPTAEAAEGGAAEPLAEELVPDSFAGMGWDTGEPGEVSAESEPEPVAEEPLAVGDAAWASVGDRAEAAWSPPAPTEAGDDVEEITTWGSIDEEALAAAEEEPGLEEPAAAESVMYTGPEPDTDFVFEVELIAEVEESEPRAGGSVAGEAAPAAAAPAVGSAPRGAGEMVTATMAELYAQQGFYDRAVDVYRQLLAQVPEDERLRERLAEIEQLGEAAARQAAAAREVEESVSEAASVWTEAGGVAGGEETPYAWADSPAGEEGADAEPTAGAYFRSLLQWRPAQAVDSGEVLDLTDATLQGSEGAVDLEAGAVAAAFEEWFGEKPEDRGEEAAEGEPGEDDADLAMFRSWLQSLKK